MQLAAALVAIIAITFVVSVRRAARPVVMTAEAAARFEMRRVDGSTTPPTEWWFEEGEKGSVSLGFAFGGFGALLVAGGTVMIVDRLPVPGVLSALLGLGFLLLAAPMFADRFLQPQRTHRGRRVTLGPAEVTVFTWNNFKSELRSFPATSRPVLALVHVVEQVPFDTIDRGFVLELSSEQRFELGRAKTARALEPIARATAAALGVRLRREERRVQHPE